MKIPVPKSISDNVERIHRTKVNSESALEEKVDDKALLLLDKAKEIVSGARRQAYGNPEDNFKCIASLWSVYLLKAKGGMRFQDGESVLTSADVATMMILMKCARLAETPMHGDSMLDIAGYAACMARCAKE